MLKKSAPIRFFSNSVGLVFQILTIFFTTKYLGIYQFALWGVANSLIYIFSSLNQFGYVQNIEKFFPNYDDNLKIHYFSKFFKTLILMLPIWLFILYILNTANFFEKSPQILHEIFVCGNCLIISKKMFFEKKSFTKKNQFQKPKNKDTSPEQFNLDFASWHFENLLQTHHELSPDMIVPGQCFYGFMTALMVLARVKARGGEEMEWVSFFFCF